jgi:hypothetical protein
MSKILRRPMFRGGAVDSRGTGITSGLDRPGYALGGAEIYSRAESQVPQIQDPSLSVGDYLRIAATGAKILGAPGEGGGIRGALTAAAGPLSELGVGLGESIDTRRSKAIDRRASKVRDIAELDTGIEVAKIKSKGEIEAKLALLDSITEVKKEAIQANEALSDKEKEKAVLELELKYNKDREEFVLKGGDLSDYYKLGSQAENIKAAKRAAIKRLKAEQIGPDKPEYVSKLAQYQGEYLAQLVQSFGSSFAEGGAVGATPMMEMGEEKPVPLSYDELRARLPQSISDDIVRLLATSYEALADFAEIRTQTDVNAFNTKYQVQLVLPQEA